MAKPSLNIPTKFYIPLGIIAFGLAYSIYQVVDYRGTRVPAMQTELQKMNAEKGKKKAEHTRLQNFVSNIEGIKSELRELNAQEEKALESMPATFNLSALLRRFTLLAQNTGVEMVFFKPRNDEAAKGGSFYKSQTIELQLQGAFTETLLFFDQISRLKRIINVETISINTDTSKQTGSIRAVTRTVVRAYRFAE